MYCYIIVNKETQDIEQCIKFDCNKEDLIIDDNPMIDIAGMVDIKELAAHPEAKLIGLEVTEQELVTALADTGVKRFADDTEEVKTLISTNESFTAEDIRKEFRVRLGKDRSPIVEAREVRCMIAPKGKIVDPRFVTPEDLDDSEPVRKSTEDLILEALDTSSDYFEFKSKLRGFLGEETYEKEGVKA